MRSRGLNQVRVNASSYLDQLRPAFSFFACHLDNFQLMTRTNSGMREKENQMKQTRSESTSTGTGTGETKGVATGHNESVTISETYSDDSLGRGVSDDQLNIESERRPRVSGWSGEPRESVTILIEGGGFSFNDVFPMESRLSAAQCGREIATYALSLVAHPLAASRRRRSPNRQVEE